MTEQLHQLIQDIRSKSQQLAEKLRVERAQHEVLQGEINRLNEQLLAEQAHISDLKHEIAALNVSLDEAQNKVVEVPVVSKGRDDAQIDALVKEIEYCIEQLKQG
ncbi:MAG: hypothetical protein RLZZ301_592 [Bacteroidota bacterium]|jgi:predicted  nucleic acid-binding Zn-ribbon protein